MTSWVCLVCGYVHDGDEPPAHCPLCGAPPSRFARQEEGEVKFESPETDKEQEP